MSRSYFVTLMQNLGNGMPGESLALSESMTTLDGISWEVDKELTKLAPGDLSASVIDDDGSVWSWLQTQIQTSGALFPPFMVLDVDGVRVFTGIVQPSAIERDNATAVVSLNATDWSAMLASKALTADAGWTRPEPRAIASRPASETHTNTYLPLSVIYIGQIKAGGGRDCAHFPEPMNWLAPGDLVDAETPQGNHAGLKVLEIQHDLLPGICRVKFDQILWSFTDWNASSYTGTFTRQASTTTPQGYYKVAVAVPENPDPKVYRITLDTIDGQWPGDVLQLLNADRSATFTVAQLDASRSSILVNEEVSNLAVGDRLYFSDESAAQMVMEDPRRILTAACTPFSADFSKATATTLDAPILSWVPMRPATGADLRAVSDIESGLNNFRVFSGVSAWDGTPEAGWSDVATSTKRTTWTDQRLTAPSSLMPYELASLAPLSYARNEAEDLNYRNRPKMTSFGTVDTTAPWTPPATPAAAVSANVVVYDYLQMRRIALSGAAGSIMAWSGSAWGSSTAITWPDTVNAACVFVGGPAGSIIALGVGGLRAAVLPSGWASTLLTIPAAAKDAVLKTTPWGTYLVGSAGYGRITVSGSALSLNWVTLSTDGSTKLLPNTFQGIDDTEQAVLATVSGMDRQGKTSTETHLLRLAATPTTTPTAGASILWDEKILEGSPISCGAVRDPSQDGRVIGHVGGRLYQVSAVVPVSRALERFKPAGMHASELIEHICQVLNLVAYPAPDGTMHFASRAASTVIPLTVDQTSLIETRAWEHFYSIVRVSGQDDVLFDAYSAVDGGQLLEISGHPLLWTVGACSAMASVYAAWFGRPRAMRKEEWFYTDPTNAAPWEGLQPLSTVTVNGAGPYLLMALKDDRVKGTASVMLLEV